MEIGFCVYIFEMYLIDVNWILCVLIFEIVFDYICNLLLGVKNCGIVY